MNKKEMTKTEKELIKAKIQYRSLQVAFWAQFAFLFVWVNYDWVINKEMFGINFWVIIGEAVIWALSQLVIRKFIEKKIIKQYENKMKKNIKIKLDEEAYIEKQKEHEDKIKKEISNL